MTTSPAMASKIELWALDQLTPYAHNARTHSDDQIARIAASMLEFGVNNPILVDSKGGIVAGHGRLLAARKLDLSSVPVVVLDHLSEAQVESLDSLAGPTFLPTTACRTCRMGYGVGRPDTDLLASELAELVGDFDLGMMGFDDAELQKILGASDESDDESAPDKAEEGHNNNPDEPDSVTPVPPVSRSGDVWLLGRHRLICGDSTQAETVQKLMGSAGKPSLAALSFTSPPYGNQRDYTAGIDDWDSRRLIASCAVCTLKWAMPCVLMVKFW